MDALAIVVVILGALGALVSLVRGEKLSGVVIGLSTLAIPISFVYGPKIGSVAILILGTLVALILFVRRGKANDRANQFSLSPASDLAKSGQGALSLTEEDYALGAIQADSVFAEGLCQGDSVVLTTNRGGRERSGVVTKVFANEDVLVEIDDSTGRFTTRRPAASFRRLGE